MTELGGIEAIRASFIDHPGYRHGFWEWFGNGDFDAAELRRFALAYYRHVVRFRLYIAGALTIAPTERLQIVLARNLADEYGVHVAGQSPNFSHPEMFRRFMRSIGLTETEWDNYETPRGVRRFQEIHFALFRGGLVPETFGAVIFGMESSTLYRYRKVMEGLRKFEARTYLRIDSEFFAQHVVGDEIHSEELISAASTIIEDDFDGVVRGAHLSFDARKLLLDDLTKIVRAEHDK